MSVKIEITSREIETEIKTAMKHIRRANTPHKAKLLGYRLAVTDWGISLRVEYSVNGEWQDYRIAFA